MNLNNPNLREFSDNTKNAAIFKTSAPYRNPYQGNSARWLFVCSAGLLRSPTGATMAAKYNINARSCGSNFNYALVPCSANLIMWANKIIFVNKQNLEQLETNFAEHPELLREIKEKSVVLNIPDNFDYMNPELQDIYNQQLFSVYCPETV
jgi:predicted protein tyrosine phosphatase